MQSDQRLSSVGYFFASAPLAKHHPSDVRDRRPNIARAMRLRHIQRGLQRIKAMFCNANPKRKIAPAQSARSASRHSPETGDRNDSLCATHILACLCCAREPSWSSLFKYATGQFVSNCHFCFTSSPYRSKIDPWSGLHLKH